MNKTIWMNVLISAIVAIVVFSLMSMIGPSIGLSPGLKTTTLPDPGIINANSCNADEVCEMQSIQGIRNLTLGIYAYDVRVNGGFSTDSLIGNGTAYVCTTFKGSVYRSSTPCV